MYSKHSILITRVQSVTHSNVMALRSMDVFLKDLVLLFKKGGGAACCPFTFYLDVFF
ncbi:hypothetical protein Hanom_Chr04g00285721 [Helianthus anomalus]